MDSSEHIGLSSYNLALFHLVNHAFYFTTSHRTLPTRNNLAADIFRTLTSTMRCDKLSKTRMTRSLVVEHHCFLVAAPETPGCSYRRYPSALPGDGEERVHAARRLAHGVAVDRQGERDVAVVSPPPPPLSVPLRILTLLQFSIRTALFPLLARSMLSITAPPDCDTQKTPRPPSCDLTLRMRMLVG